MPGVSRQMQLRCSFLAMAPVCAWACSSRLDAASGPFSKPIRFIVPYAAAGGTDIVARVYGGNLSKRNPAVPDLPTVAEAGVPGYEVNQWYGVVTSAKTPQAFVDALSAEIALSARDPELVQRLKNDGVDAVSSKPAELSARIKAEIAKWASLVKNAGLVLQ